MSPWTTMPAKNFVMFPPKVNCISPRNAKNSSHTKQMEKGFEEERSQVSQESKITLKKSLTHAENHVNTIETFEKSPTFITEQPSGKSSKNSSDSGRILLSSLHPYICCTLCSGYLIKPTTIVECLHTFCHSCLMKHLSTHKKCPQCGIYIMKSKTNIK